MANEKNEDVRVYELGYLISPIVGEENLPHEMSMLKDAVANLGANFITEEYPKFIELAYRMEKSIANKLEKFTQAYFGWMKFELEPEKVETLEEMLRKNDKIIRHILFKTVRENTLAPRKFHKTETHRRKPNEQKVEVNVEEIDKEIDALIGDEVVETPKEE